MFERFRTRFASSRGTAVPHGSTWRDDRFARVEGYEEFAAEFAGATFLDGLYRVHDASSGPKGLRLIAEAFPEFSSRMCPFGYDWLGRQFGIDSSRVQHGQPQVLMLEPGTGLALEIPASFSQFHEVEAIDNMDAALAADFFEDWSANHLDLLPLPQDQCVGYRIPLFLGGPDELSNLELSDLDVYWSLCGQLRLGTGSLMPGTPIIGVKYEE